MPKRGDVKIRTGDDKDLDGGDDEDVVDVESRVAVVECEEAVHGQLRAEVVVLSREHLLAHTGSDLGLEVQDRAETHVSSLSALVVLRVLDPTSSTEGGHSGVDVLVQVQTLLGLGDSSSGVHEDGVEEIGVTVVELSSDPRHGPGGERSERLLLTGGDVSENSDVCEEQEKGRQRRRAQKEGERERGDVLSEKMYSRAPTMATGGFWNSGAPH